jgi:hypothetical protein
MNITACQPDDTDPHGADNDTSPVLAAMSDWRRTLRLCMIRACENVPLVLAAWIVGRR